MKKVVVEFKPLRSDVALPIYKTPGCAAFDLVSPISLSLAPGQKLRIPLGFAVWVKDPEYALEIIPRSGKGVEGLGLKNLTGLIDSDYQGELIFVAWNTNPQGTDPIAVTKGDSIGQAFIVQIARAEFSTVSEFSGTSERSEGGFGSTDRKPAQDDIFKI